MENEPFGSINFLSKMVIFKFSMYICRIVCYTSHEQERVNKLRLKCHSAAPRAVAAPTVNRNGPGQATVCEGEPSNKPSVSVM